MSQKPKQANPKKVKEDIKTTKQVIQDIEKALDNSRVIVYIEDLSIGPWDVMPIYSLLTTIGKVDKLNLILDSSGGYADDAYKIAGVLHEFCNTLTVIVPFKAKSAATILSLAANEILMSPLGELGPCDPMITVDESLITPTGLPATPTANGEGEEEGKSRKKRQMNALALRDFLEVAGILQKDEQGKITGYDCEKLIPFCEKGVLNPWLLGDFERSSKQSRQFVENLLTRYMFRDDPSKSMLIPDIAHKLCEGYYYHGYPISRREAHEMGLIVHDLPDEPWKLISELMSAYNHMKREQKLYSIIESSDSHYVEKYRD